LIRFEAKCDTKCHVEGFVNRDGEIIKRTVVNEFTDSWEEKFHFELQEDDAITLFVLPADGKTHLIKTAIYVDGELLADQDKVCHAAGGCTAKIQ